MTSQRDQIAKLTKIAEDFARDNHKLRAKVPELESKQSVHWVPLKAADRGAFVTPFEFGPTRGSSSSKKVGSRIYVNADSLRDYLAMLAA